MPLPCPLVGPHVSFPCCLSFLPSFLALFIFLLPFGSFVSFLPRPSFPSLSSHSPQRSTWGSKFTTNYQLPTTNYQLPPSSVAWILAEIVYMPACMSGFTCLFLCLPDCLPSVHPACANYVFHWDWGVVCLISFRFGVPLLSLLSFSSFFVFPSFNFDIAPEVINLQEASWVAIFPGDSSHKKIWRRFLLGQFFVNATTGSSQGGACSTNATASKQGHGYILFAALAHLINGSSNETKAGSTIYTHLVFAALVLCRWCENCQPLGAVSWPPGADIWSRRCTHPLAADRGGDEDGGANTSCRRGDQANVGVGMRQRHETPRG